VLKVHNVNCGHQRYGTGAINLVGVESPNHRAIPFLVTPETKMGVIVTFEVELPFVRVRLPMTYISRPLVYIKFATKRAAAEFTILWDNWFSQPHRLGYEVEEECPWDDFESMLSYYYNNELGAQLTDHNKDALKTACPMTEDERVQRKMIVSQKIIRNYYTFWDWFASAVDLGVKHLKPLLEKGVIFGFGDKKVCEHLLRSSRPGTFMLRFSDNNPGSISLCCNVKTGDDDDAASQVIHLTPWQAESLVSKNLAKRLQSVQDLETFYPDRNKHHVLKDLIDERRHKEPHRLVRDGYVDMEFPRLLARFTAMKVHSRTTSQASNYAPGEDGDEEYAFSPQDVGDMPLEGVHTQLPVAMEGNHHMPMGVEMQHQMALPSLSALHMASLQQTQEQLLLQQQQQQQQHQDPISLEGFAGQPQLQRSKMAYAMAMDGNSSYGIGSSASASPATAGVVGPGAGGYTATVFDFASEQHGDQSAPHQSLSQPLAHSSDGDQGNNTNSSLDNILGHLFVADDKATAGSMPVASSPMLGAVRSAGDSAAQQMAGGTRGAGGGASVGEDASAAAAAAPSSVSAVAFSPFQPSLTPSHHQLQVPQLQQPHISMAASLPVSSAAMLWPSQQQSLQQQHSLQQQQQDLSLQQQQQQHSLQQQQHSLQQQQLSLQQQLQQQQQHSLQQQQQQQHSQQQQQQQELSLQQQQQRHHALVQHQFMLLRQQQQQQQQQQSIAQAQQMPWPQLQMPWMPQQTLGPTYMQLGRMQHDLAVQALASDPALAGASPLARPPSSVLSSPATSALPHPPPT
jgi:hypothetical protein